MQSSGRERRARLALETLEVIKAGGYPAISTGQWIDLSDSITTSRSGTVVYRSAIGDRSALHHTHATTFDFDCDCSLMAASRLVDSGCSVAVLNFASAKHPGGGWLKGAQAHCRER